METLLVGANKRVQTYLPINLIGGVHQFIGQCVIPLEIHKALLIILVINPRLD